MENTEALETSSIQEQPEVQQESQETKKEASNGQLTSEASSKEELEKKMEDAGLSEKEKASLRKKFQLKVNNKVKDVEIDLGNEEEVKKYLQKAIAADEKFQEAAMTKKQMEALVMALKTNPLAVLSHPELGVNVKQLAEMILAKEIEEAQKSPEQKRIEELERALKEKEEKERLLEEQRRAAEIERMEQEIAINLDKEITEALKNSSLPKSPYVVKRIADAMYSAIEMGYTDIPVSKIIPFVEQQIYGELQQLFDSSPEDILPSLLERFAGKKNLERYRKSILSKIKAKPIEKPKIEDTGAKSAEVEEKDKKVLDVKNLMSLR